MTWHLFVCVVADFAAGSEVDFGVFLGLSLLILLSDFLLFFSYKSHDSSVSSTDNNA